MPVPDCAPRGKPTIYQVRRDRLSLVGDSSLKDDVIPRGRVCHDIPIEGVAFANRSPVCRLDSRRPEKIHPAGRKVHIDQELDVIVRAAASALRHQKLLVETVLQSPIPQEPRSCAGREGPGYPACLPACGRPSAARKEPARQTDRHGRSQHFRVRRGNPFAPIRPGRGPHIGRATLQSAPGGLPALTRNRCWPCWSRVRQEEARHRPAAARWRCRPACG
jgi:hypothetical protein